MRQVLDVRKYRLGGKLDAKEIEKEKFSCRLCNTDMELREMKEENVSLKFRLAAIEVAQATEVKSYSDIGKGAIEKERTELKTELVGLVQCKVAEVLID